VTVRGELFVQLARADIPFGVFLAAGAALALLAGRAFLVVLLGDPTPPGAGLLP
jgi:prepilin signal peptidase PulO-like enzyme (type II secretory pathway)